MRVGLENALVENIDAVSLGDMSRIDFSDKITEAELRKLVAQPQVKVLQCARPMRAGVWDLLDNVFFAARPDVELRLYGFYSDQCDLSMARDLKNVRRFSADCLRRAINVEAIADIPHLESLSLGVFELDDFHVLNLIPTTLKSLFLGATRSRKPDLSPLARFHGLNRLYIDGHQKNIDVLGELQNLEDLTLRSITTDDLRFLSSLCKLWSLDAKLGGIKSFAGIEDLECIQYLEIWQVRDWSQVEILSALKGLQYFFLQSLPHITALPTFTGSHSLRRVTIENLKGLCDFSALEYAPSLEEFCLIDGRKQLPQQLLPLLRNPSVRRAAGFFGSDKKNLAFRSLCKEYGKEEWSPYGPFQYR